MASQQFCLRWNNYQSNLMQVFDQLLQNESFVDVTLSCEGQSVKAHRMVLSACSPYFQCLLNDAPCSHPVIILQGVKLSELKAVVEFMYKGEINICQEELGSLLRVAESLKVRGLAEVDGDGAEPAVLASPALSPATRLTTTPLDDSSPGHITFPRKRRRYSGDDLSVSRPCTPLTPISSQENFEPHLDLNNPLMRGMANTSLPGSPASLTSLAARLPGAMPPPAPMPPHLPHLPPLSPLLNMHSLPRPHAPDDFEIRPGIAEMIREEERRRRDAPDMAKLLESSHHWMGTSVADGGHPIFPTMFHARPAPASVAHTAEAPTTVTATAITTTTATKTRPTHVTPSRDPPAPALSTSQLQDPCGAPRIPEVECEIVSPSSPGCAAANVPVVRGSSTATPAGGGNGELEIAGGGSGAWGSPRGAMAAPKSGASRWTQRDLVAAVALVRAGTPIKPAAERCHIPVMTLWRRTRALGIVSSKVQCGFRYPAARRRPRPAPEVQTHMLIKPDPDRPQATHQDLTPRKSESQVPLVQLPSTDKAVPRAGPLREVSTVVTPRITQGATSPRPPGRENSPLAAPPRSQSQDGFRAWVDIMVEGAGVRSQEAPQDLTTHPRPPSRASPPSSPTPPRPAHSPLHH